LRTRLWRRQSLRHRRPGLIIPPGPRLRLVKRLTENLAQDQRGENPAESKVASPSTTAMMTKTMMSHVGTLLLRPSLYFTQKQVFRLKLACQ
jgi:hypothetical protein